MGIHAHCTHECRWIPPGVIIFDKVLRRTNWKVQEWENVLQNFPNEFSANLVLTPWP
jgi:hypothetical protein